MYWVSHFADDSVVFFIYDFNNRKLVTSFQVSATHFVDVTQEDRFYLTLLENFGEGILEMEFCGYKIG